MSSCGLALYCSVWLARRVSLSGDTLRCLRAGALSVAHSFFGVEADVGNVAVDLGVVHSVANDELVGDLEADVVGFDGHQAAFRLVEAGGDLE